MRLLYSGFLPSLSVWSLPTAVGIFFLFSPSADHASLDFLSMSTTVGLCSLLGLFLSAKNKLTCILGWAHVSEQPSVSEEVTDGMSSGGSGLRLSGWSIVLYTSMLFEVVVGHR